MPLSAYANEWIRSRKVAGDVAIKTVERYEGILRDHILPELEEVSINAISAAHIREVLGRWRTGSRHDRKSGTLSKNSIHDHFARLRQILGDGVRERLLFDNPTLFVPGAEQSRDRTPHLQFATNRCT
jgi:hypothetical protein